MTIDSNENELEEARRRKQEALTKMSARLTRMVKEARTDPIAFIRLCATDDDGNAPTIKSFHEKWKDMCFNGRFVLIEAARGLTKTSTLRLFLIHKIGSKPNLRCRILSDTDRNAQKSLGTIRELLEGSPLIPLVFPNLKIDPTRTNNQSTLNVVRTAVFPDPTIEALGVTSSGTGSRADLLWLDDICSHANTLAQPKKRQEIKSKVLNDWLPTMAPGEPAIWCTFTPWAVDDCNAYLKEETKGRWQYACFPHGTEEDPTKSIFPELYPNARLQGELRIMGRLNYSRAYRCKALTSDTQLILPEHLLPPTEDEGQLRTIYARCTVVIVVDPARGTAKSKDPDATAIGIEYHDPLTDRMFFTDIFEFRASTKVQAHVIRIIAHVLAASYIIVEAQGLSSLHEWIAENDPALPALAAQIIPIPATGAKELRLQAVTPLLESNRVRFHPQLLPMTPGHDDPFLLHTLLPPDRLTAPLMAQPVECRRTFYHQAVNFGTTTHDDSLDAMVHGVSWAHRYLSSGGQGMEKHLTLEVHAIDLNKPRKPLLKGPNELPKEEETEWVDGWPIIKKEISWS